MVRVELFSLVVFCSVLAFSSGDFFFADRDNRFGAFGNSNGLGRQSLRTPTPNSPVSQQSNTRSLSLISFSNGKVLNTPIRPTTVTAPSGGTSIFNSASNILNRSPYNNNNNNINNNINNINRPGSFIPTSNINSSGNNNSNIKNNISNNNSNNNNNHSNSNSNQSSNNINSSTNNRCIQRSSRDFRPHSKDCSKFTLCTLGRLVDFDCPPGSVFHTQTSSCVPRGSKHDMCTQYNPSCPPGFSGKVADPRHCARYFHCGRPAQQTRWESHLHECPYPMLFNSNMGRCEHYSTVNCGAREEPLDPCEYLANGCDGHVSCVPCPVRFPSCRGRTDGINAWFGRRGSPDYVVCSGGRVMYHGRCSQRSNGIQIFDEQAGGCVSLKQTP